MYGGSGGSGIRTREGVAPLHALQACPFVRSGKPPGRFYGSDPPPHPTRDPAGAARRIVATAHDRGEIRVAHPNEEVLRSSFEEFGRGDMEALRGRFAEDIRWNFPGRSQLAGTESGVDGALGWLGRTYELSGGTITTDVHDILANDTHALALFTIRAEREGRSLEDRTVGIYHVRDGRIVEAWFNPGDQYATDEFWG